MGRAVIGNIVKSHISNLVAGLKWFGAPVTAVADWSSGSEESDGVGLPFQHRLWIERPSAVSIRIETILGYSDDLPVNADAIFNINDYLFGLMNAQGYFEPADNQAALQSVSLNFSSGQPMTGTFDHVVFRPSNDLIDWFDTYASASDIPFGTGDQLQALQNEDVTIVVPDDPIVSDDGIEGITTASVSMPVQFEPIETTKKRAGFVPKLPVPVNLAFEMYHDYFVLNQSRFREGNTLSDIKIWKFRLTKPKIISVNQNNPSSGQRTWNVSLRAKNMVKE